MITTSSVVTLQMEANENAKINSTYSIPINTNVSFVSVLGKEVGGMGDTTPGF
jgi:hypothetical protein